MAQRYDALVVRKTIVNDEEKLFFTKIGTMFQGRDGKDQFMLKLSALPVGGADGEVSILLRPPIEKNNNYSKPSARASDTEDGIPF